MSRMKNLFRKVSQSNLSVAAGWTCFLLGVALSPDLLLVKVLLLSVSRVLP